MKNTDPVCAAPTKLEINRRTWADGSYLKPPQDGTPIVVIGRVLSEDDFGCCSDPFHGFVRWEKDSSGYEGWHFIGSGMVVASCLDDEVKIDWWNPLPVEVA
jgi:hypothetical protein